MSIKAILRSSSVAITGAITPDETQSIKQLGSSSFNLRNALQTNELFSQSVSEEMAKDGRCLPYLTSKGREKATLLAAAKVLVESNTLPRTTPNGVNFADKMRCLTYKHSIPEDSEIRKLRNIKNACLETVPSCENQPFMKTFLKDLKEIELAKINEEKTVVLTGKLIPDTHKSCYDDDSLKSLFSF